MKSKIIFLRSVQGLSLIAILMVLSLGFVIPVTFTQGLIINPLLFMLFVSSFSLAGSKVDKEQSLAHVHQLPVTKQTIQLPCCKAA